MLERLTANVLHRFLSQYFDYDGDDQAAIWSGFVKYQNLHLRVEKLNDKLASAGQPIRVEAGFVRNLTITVPWGKLARMDSTVVVVVDGLFLLSSVDFVFDDPTLRRGTRERRRRKLQEGSEKIGEDRITWREFFKSKLQDGLLPGLAGRIEVLIRDMHCRVENTSTTNPYAFGIVMESLHVKRDVQKFSQVNHLAVYMNSIESRPFSHSVIPENSVLRAWSLPQITLSLDRMVPRRISDVNALSLRSPAHSYLLVPVDGTIHAMFATVSQQLKNQVPIARFVMQVPHLRFEVRDFQCIQLLELYYESNTHKYRRLHYRQHRPYGSVKESPREWWKYAYNIVRLELHKHRRSFIRRFRQRNRYCDLYQRRLVGYVSADDAAGPSGGRSLATSSADMPWHQPLPPLSLFEEQELCDLEDGAEGDLTVEDLLLFRILVHKRIGYAPTLKSSTASRKSWFKRVFSNEDEEEQDYQRLVADWNEWCQTQAKSSDLAATPGLPPIAVSAELCVDSGHVAFFAPLPSTCDQIGQRRLQQKFLHLKFSRFRIKFELLRNFTSFSVQYSLHDFMALELKSDQHECTVVEQVESSSSQSVVEKAGVLELVFSKHNPDEKDYHTSLYARVRSLEIVFQVEAEWIAKMKAILKPLPQFEKATKFWKELNMARINAYVSRQLGLLVKANTLVAEHRNINLDVIVDCPILRIYDGNDSCVVMNLGRAHLRTVKLAGVADILLSRVPQVHPRGQVFQSLDDQNLRDKYTWFKQSETVPDKPFNARTGSGHQSPSLDSVDYSCINHVDDSASYMDPAEPEFQDVDSRFYDVYQIYLEPAGIVMMSPDGDQHQLLSPLQISLLFLKSVLPADHTISRYKIRVTIPELTLVLSGQSINHFGAFLARWSACLSKDIPSPVHPNIKHLWLDIKQREEGELGAELEAESSGSDSTFDENEFFDAAESDMQATYQTGMLLDDAWTADAESLVDCETRSFRSRTPNREARRRQPSEVSSISDASVRNRPSKSFQGAFYLSAENLARLEEEAAGEESDVEADLLSFHSAVTTHQLNAIKRGLLEDSQWKEKQVLQLRKCIARWRRQSAGMAVSAPNEKNQMVLSGLRLELQRSEVELKALHASILDVAALEASVNSDQGAIYCGDRKLLSLKRATALLQPNRGTARPVPDVDEHTLTRKLKRDSLTVLFSILQIRLQLVIATEMNSTKCLEQRQLDFSLSQNIVVFRQIAGESRAYASIENLEGCLCESQQERSHRFCFLTGGVNYELVGGLLPSRFPNLDPGSTDDKFVRCAIEMKGTSGLDSAKLVKMSLCLGDIECTTHPIVLGQVQRYIRHLKSRPPKRSRDPMISRRPIRFDLSARISAARLLLLDNLTFAACVISGAGIRVLSLPQPLEHDRVQLSGTCNNIQFLRIHEYDSGSGMEVFGKEETSSPILRFRIRYQDTPESETQGWVSSSPSRSLQVHSRIEALVKNSHVGLKIDGFSLRITTDLFLVIERTSRILGGLFVAESLKEPAVGHNLIQAQTVRWRVDFSMRKSSLVLAADRDLTDLPFKGADHLKELLFRFSALAILQPSSSSKKNLVFRLKIQDILAVGLPGNKVILEPAEITMTASAPLSSQYPKSALCPQLLFPDVEFWTVTSQLAPEHWIPLDSVSQVNFLVFFSAVRICAIPSALALLLDLCSCLSSPKVNLNENQVKTLDGVESTKKEFKPLKLYVDLDGIRMGLAQDQRTAGPHPLVIFELVGVQLNLSHLPSTKSVILSVDFGSVTDHLFPLGIVSLSGGCRRLSTSRSGSNNAGCGFLNLRYQESKVSNEGQKELYVHAGKINILPLPTCIRSTLDFFKSVNVLRISGLDRQPFTYAEQPRVPSDMLLPVGSLAIELKTELIDFTLSSRDIPVFLSSASNEAVSVISFRLKTAMKGSLSTSDGGGEVISKTPISEDPTKRVVQRALVQYLSNPSDRVARSTCCGLTVHIKECQVLRTSISRSQSVPVSFIATPPLAGEQRITNTFDCSLTYRIASWSLFAPGALLSTSATAAHSIHIRAGFVDLLLYIRQSAGGITDALKTSIIPILDMFKNKSKASQNSKRLHPQYSLKDMIRGAPLMISMRMTGLKVTCVPGGATRLTESPIIKVSLSNVSSGAAVTSVSTDQEILFSSVNSSGRQVFAGAWLNCSLSASYHNRRLVRWEPFVEPWKLKLHVGIDLSRTARLGSLYENGLESGRGKEPCIEHQVNVLDMSGSRLKSIGRLLRSPFHPDPSSRDSSNFSGLKTISSDIDFCYLSLLLWSLDIVGLALPPNETNTQTTIHTILPHERPVQWLNQFGYPFDGKTLPSDFTNQPALSCRATDDNALNINITGALIETVSDYLGQTSADPGELPPHWIQNDSGLTLRFQEVLELEQVARFETAPKVTMACDTKLPLSLKRSVSQSCDPHMAYISIELGSFEDTINRVDSTRLAAHKGSRSSAFSYKIKERIPVDTVGFQRYPLDWNSGIHDEAASVPNTGSLGWIIVRVALAGGTKLVYIESSLFLRNSCDSDLLCEIRDHDGLSLLWRSLLPRANPEVAGFIPVPADIVPNQSYKLSAIALPLNSGAQHESELTNTCIQSVFTALCTPRPYSRTSLSKGIIDQKNVSLQVLGPESRAVNLNVCSVRIGAIVLEQTPRALTSLVNSIEAPEQRMMLFRPTLAITNHLAFPVCIQARVKASPRDMASEGKWAKQTTCGESELVKWSDLGTVECGKAVSWTGASSSDEVELRLRFERSVEGSFHDFFDWSSVTTVPSDEADSSQMHASVRPYISRLPDIKVHDRMGTALLLSVALCHGNTPTEATADCSSVESFAKQLQSASRVVALFTPFWVIDSSRLDLQYKSGSFVSDGSAPFENQGLEAMEAGTCQVPTASLGLAEVLDSQDFSHLPSRQPCEVFMIGSEGSRHLQVRRRESRFQPQGCNSLAPWSDPIPLSIPDGSYYDAAVLPAPEIPHTLMSHSLHSVSPQVDIGQELEVFAIRTRISKAPEICGGHYGTRFVQVVCRYQVVNELGCSIEVSGTENGMPSRPALVMPDCLPHAFHFNDTCPVQFRPKEYGWAWSGRFRVQERRELTICLHHKLKDTKILATVEFHSKQTSGTCFIFFRIAPHAPYRLENRTVHAINYHQIAPHSSYKSSRSNLDSKGPLVLPYHDAEFAWEDPESAHHAIALHLAACDDHSSERMGPYIGTIRIDRTSLGSNIQLRSKRFLGQMLADGPTRVIRILEQAKADSTLQHHHHQNHHPEQQILNYKPLSAFTWKFTVKLLQGIGLSVVDWTPQELLFMRLEDVFIEKANTGAKRSFVGAIGRMIVDNQLWVTPFPVLMQIGSRSQRRRHRRHSALLLSWSRQEASGTGYSDTSIFQEIELSSEPITICIDGNLTRLLLVMLQQLNEVRSTRSSAGSGVLPVDSAKDRLPNIQQVGCREAIHEPYFESSTHDFFDLVDRMSTNPIAAKLRRLSRSAVDTTASQCKNDLHSSSRTRDNLARNRHKYYIERLCISTIAAEISWSGALPIASSLPGFLRPSFTFQGLPVLFRPLYISNSYGTTNEHVDSLRSHYMSIWRIFDLIAGILTKPSFLSRAVIFSWRESIGSAFDTITRSLQSSESIIVKLTMAIQAQTSPPILWAFTGPFVQFNLVLVHSLATFTSAASRIFRFHVSQRITAGTLIRSRNPRFFENVNGRDLLVEYVEGENAGKAFLSRVDTGKHLCEGYNFHLEGVFLSAPTKEEPIHFIVILTFERVMLVSGQLNESFCDVVWKALFTDVLCVELRASGTAQNPDLEHFVCLQWWVCNCHSTGHVDERFTPGPHADVGGLAAISSCQMLVPKQSSYQMLLSKLKQANLRCINLLDKKWND